MMILLSEMQRITRQPESLNRFSWIQQKTMISDPYLISGYFRTVVLFLAAGKNETALEREKSTTNPRGHASSQRAHWGKGGDLESETA